MTYLELYRGVRDARQARAEMLRPIAAMVNT